ncbi:hypothetical protein [Priestia koreensis]|uniref:hypothetical protein n=1 Tax=Priestia koreensis TaxID=284581 RepID=UPI00203AED59|nr:hypothetical protein [Priestia koreensis]MCM3006309.1 hypothetical protein [Priestia koreensis]
MEKKRLLSTVLVTSLVAMGFSTFTKAPTVQAQSQQTVSSQKEWEFVFEHGMNKELIVNKGIYIKNSKEQIISTKIHIKDDHTVIVKPPVKGYRSGETYRLYIKKGIDLQYGESGKPAMIVFKVK